MSEKQEPMMRTLLTEKEAADHLRCSRTTLWRERKDGRISFRKVGGALRYHIDEDLNEYLKRCKRSAFTAVA